MEHFHHPPHHTHNCCDDALFLPAAASLSSNLTPQMTSTDLVCPCHHFIKAGSHQQEENLTTTTKANNGE
uniref:Uncharacterized protein n=1 Tax=Ditylenchus dipsaci TaxID=166011 RepID=A0A915EDI1_9BILA